FVIIYLWDIQSDLVLRHVCLNLSTYSLDGYILLSNMCGESLHCLLLVRDDAGQFCDCGLLFLNASVLVLEFTILFPDSAVFFKELVEQHGVHLVVADTERFTFLVERHQAPIHFSDFLGDQAKLRPVLTVLLVMKGYWFKR